MSEMKIKETLLEYYKRYWCPTPESDFSHHINKTAGITRFVEHLYKAVRLPLILVVLLTFRRNQSVSNHYIYREINIKCSELF